jgi:signal transduction histidine kinase
MPDIPTDGHLQEVNEEIYKHNLELAVVNKTLSLLRKLYQISLLTLDPVSLSEKISGTIRSDLNMEFVGIFAFDEKTDTLKPFTFSKVERLKELLVQSGIVLKNIPIPEASKHQTFNKVIHLKTSVITSDLKEIWGGLIDPKILEKISTESHIKTVLLFPLVTPEKIAGILVMGLNRAYESINDHEKESYKSCIDVTSVALDKSYLYKALQDANEKLKGLDKLKTEFLSLASHQLRSPLTAIKGYASMVLEGDFGEINPKAREAVDRVFQSSQNLMKIVEDLLNVSKIEQGGMKYEMATFSLAEIARDMEKDLSITAAKNKGLQLSFESDSDESCMVNGDKEKIRQVVLNFIDNSIKYTKEGEIHVSVIKKDKKIQFRVKDTGMGMTPEIRETLFQKFARGDGARMNTGGSGLGLYLAKEIVEAHKGTVIAESEGPGKGSTFGFDLDSLN